MEITDLIRSFSIFERIGPGGGGKVKAVYHRLNALAEMPEVTPILLCLDHNIRRKITFAELQSQGVLAPRVQFLTTAEALGDRAVYLGATVFDGFPDHDTQEVSGQKITYRLAGREVMVDRNRTTPIGRLTRRSVPHREGQLDYVLVDGLPHQKVLKKADGITEITDYARGLPISWMRMRKRAFLLGRDLVTGKTYHMARAFHCGLFGAIPWQDAVVFFDGVTSAFLSPVVQAPRALYLHADHRGPSGQVVPRSRFLIENFKGEAIVTSTEIHKTRMQADVRPSAPIHVIPHFCQTLSGRPKGKRQDLVTVSRLDLAGKPIHECIAAFAGLMEDFPGVDYLIYGLGSGEERLRKQIEDLGLGNRVRLMGYTDKPLQVFQRALASVYPTMTEGFGLSILEALSNGCPVISYDVDYGPREMIRPGKSGELVTPGDIAGIEAAMRRVLAAPGAYSRATQDGMSRYSRGAYLQNYRALLHHLRRGSEIPSGGG